MLGPGHTNLRCGDALLVATYHGEHRHSPWAPVCGLEHETGSGQEALRKGGSVPTCGGANHITSMHLHNLPSIELTPGC